jgi:hypothetical protein
MINFNLLFQYGQLVIELNRLLGVRFVPGSPGYNSPLSYSERAFFEHGNKGDIQSQQFELAKLLFLVKNLQDIEAKRPDVLKKIRKKMKQAIIDPGNYLGLRFEINVASTLINTGVEIIYNDAPDFTIKPMNSADLFVECGSVHITKDIDSGYIYKLKSVLNEKSKKPYANAYTALFIDITNMLYMSLKNKTMELDKIREVVNKFANISYGSVVLFTYFANFDLNRFECNYIRIDNSNIENKLRTFLDLFYPFGEHEVRNFGLFSEG